MRTRQEISRDILSLDCAKGSMSFAERILANERMAALKAEMKAVEAATAPAIPAHRTDHRSDYTFRRHIDEQGPLTLTDWNRLNG